MIPIKNSKTEIQQLEKNLLCASFVYSIFGIGDINYRGENYLKLTLLLRLFQVTVIFLNFTFEFPAYTGNTSGAISRLMNFMFTWTDLMKVLSICFRGIVRPNAVKNLIADIVKMEKSIREISGSKKRRSVWLYRGLFFANTWVPIIICASHMINWIDKPGIPIAEILQVFNRFGLVLMHSSFCTFALVIYLQLKDTNDQYKKLKSFHLSLAKRICILRIAVEQHSLITKEWNQLIEFYEPYLFFEMISVTAAALSGFHLVYHCFNNPGKISLNDVLPFQQFLLAVQIGYEVVIICKLCTTVITEVSKFYCLCSQFKIHIY